MNLSHNILGLSFVHDITFDLCSINPGEWLLCHWICSVSSIVTVSLYPTLSSNAFIPKHKKWKKTR